MSRARKRKEDMNGSSFGVVLSGAGADAERSAGERSEPQRSAATVPEASSEEYKPSRRRRAPTAPGVAAAASASCRMRSLYSAAVSYTHLRAHETRHDLV